MPSRHAACGVIRTLSHEESRAKTKLALFSHTPGWWWRLFAGAIYRTFFQHPHGFLNRALQLRVAARDHIFWPVLNVNVRSDAFVLHRPLIVASKEPTTRSNH